jgi:hypothetical protein
LVTWRNVDTSQAVKTYIDELRKVAQPNPGGSPDTADCG